MFDRKMCDVIQQPTRWPNSMLSWLWSCTDVLAELALPGDRLCVDGHWSPKTGPKLTILFVGILQIISHDSSKGSQVVSARSFGVFSVGGDILFPFELRPVHAFEPTVFLIWSLSQVNSNANDSTCALYAEQR